MECDIESYGRHRLLSVIGCDDAGNEAGVAAGLPRAENTES